MDSENMKYAIDKIEEKIVILENINNKEKKEVSLDALPNNIHEGNIVIYEDNKYLLDTQEEDIRRKRIMDKFNRLKK